jgi:hypothetical protein
MEIYKTKPTVSILALFPPSFDNEVTFDIDSYSEGFYSQNTMQNVSSVTYEINGVVTALPFSLADADSLKISVTIINDSLISKVKIL